MSAFQSHQAQFLKVFDIFVEVFNIVVDVEIAAGEECLKFKLSDAKNATSFAECQFFALEQQED